ncbi:hypothetical protein [Paraconexibacter algicola]|uniref:Uncharacterized protein n=1 Tax=Paraconexibacter algicola TaxID=2133960 RepID=A0A2T4UDE0_9ACTN|nr:hypothetical protein [Paraconexibacter algicola]PTL55519.1 hypothetical protein C7Y72_17880 [Paraconexibacter algicola]
MSDLRDVVASARTQAGTTLDPSRLYVRREPDAADPAGNAVRVVGVVDEFSGSEFLYTALVVESADYGSIPEEWATARVCFTIEDFTDEYREADASATAVLHAEQTIASKASTAEAEKRESPWAYVPTTQRRTGKARA